MPALFPNFEPIPAVKDAPAYLCDAIERSEKKIIAIIGPSASGKTRLANALLGCMGTDRAVMISLDDYWKYTRAEMQERNLTGYDWGARKKPLFLKHLAKLKARKIVIIEGTVDLHDIADFTIFTYAPDAVLIKRRIARDHWAKIFRTEREFKKYLRTESLPSYHAKLLPLFKESDIILNTSTGVLYQPYAASAEKNHTP